jgi:hypothetical protein
MLGKRNKYIGGGTGAIISAAWVGYSNFTTMRDLGEDAGWVAKMIADPPVYAPWLLLVVCLLFLAWVFWEHDEPENPPASTTNQTSQGSGNQLFGSIGTANFNSTPHAPTLGSAAMAQRAEMLRDIDSKFCVSVVEMLDLLRLHDTFQNNLLIGVGAQCGLAHIEKDAFERAQDFFEGGGTVLTTHISNFSGGPAPELKLPKNKIVYVNYTKEAGEIMKELKKLSQSPFIPDDVKRHLENLGKEIDSIFREMIVFLDECYQNQRIRFTMAVGDANVAGGLFNDFMRKSIDLETPITSLRAALSRSLT